MTETIAAYLLQRLVAELPYLDGSTGTAHAVGLVRTYEHTIGNGDDVRRVKVPLPVSFTATECEHNERFLLPDAQTAAVLFFEDGGTISQGAGKPMFERTMESTLSLRLWLNPTVGTPPETELELVAGLYNALGIGIRQQANPLKDLLLSWTIQPGGAGLLGNYTMGGDTPSPLLYPPFRVFGAEIKCNYRFNPTCPLVSELPANDRFNYTFINGAFPLA